MGYALQKLAGWFRGHGLEGTGQAFESMGLRPGRVHATGAGVSETAGGALLAAGLLTPLAAAMLSGTMITAIRKVHAPNGPWAAEGGYEYNLVMLAAVFAVTDLGPGQWSLDEALGIRRSGPGWAIAPLAAAAGGSAAVLAFAERQPVSPADSAQPFAAGETPVGGEGTPQGGPDGQAAHV